MACKSRFFASAQVKTSALLREPAHAPQLHLLLPAVSLEASTMQSDDGLFGSGNTGRRITGATRGFRFGANLNTQQAGQISRTRNSGGTRFGVKPADHTGTQPATGGLFCIAAIRPGQADTGFGTAAPPGGGSSNSTANKSVTDGYPYKETVGLRM